jgi:multidrug resistance efflux pump
VAAQAPGAGAAAPIRLSGTVEAVQARTVSVPRLQGPLVPLVVIGLVRAGTRVEPGDPLVEFDRQQQERDAFDRRAELINLEADIEKKRAEQRATDAKDLTELKAAEHDVARAELEVRKNDLIPRIDAEKNTLALEQARARYEQLKTTYDLKRVAAAADLEILQIRRDRAERAVRYAESNAKLMEVRAPFAGLVVIKRVYRNGAFVEVAEGDEVRPGTPIVDIVDTSVMRVRARVNQADIGAVRPGARARIGLDGFPDLTFDGVVETVTPLATSSRLAETVRSFTAVISIDGTHQQLLPDLTASVEIVPDAAAADLAVMAQGTR